MIVLDAHVWVWWVNSVPGSLTENAIRKIESEEARAGVASISCLEVALLVKKGRLELPCRLAQWFDLALDGSQIELLALSPTIAEASVDLPEIHKGPADRIIIAIALFHQARLATADETIRRYPGIELAW